MTARFGAFEMQMESIAVATSLTPESDRVVRAALAVARAAEARMQLIHVVRPALASFVPVADLSPDAEPERRRDDAGGALRQQILRLGLERQDVAGWTISVGSPGGAIVRAARSARAGLLVVGAAEGQQVTLGGVAEAVLRESPIPVLLVRGDLAMPPERVLLPVDLSSLSGDALRFGRTWIDQVAGASRPECRVLFVLSDEQRLAAPQFTAAQLERLACAELARFAAGADAEGIDREVRAGEVRDEILAAARAWQADLVVVGSHGAGGHRRWAPGGVAAAVARAAGCSVLVVPPEHAARLEAQMERDILDSGDWSWVTDEMETTSERR
jgi:nucleotide-binding universal stress UspA family protein